MDRPPRRGEGEQIPRGPLEVGGFASAHPGTVQIATADGSCRSLSDDIDAEALRQLGHRADGALQSRY